MQCQLCKTPLHSVLTAGPFAYVCSRSTCAMRGMRVDARGNVEAWNKDGPRADVRAANAASWRELVRILALYDAYVQERRRSG